MSNPDSRPSSEDGQEPSKISNTRTSEASTEVNSSNEDKENRPPTGPLPELVWISYDSNLSVGWDIERVEYGNDAEALQEAFEEATEKMGVHR